MRHAHDKHSTIVNTEHWVFIDNGWGVEEMTHTQGAGSWVLIMLKYARWCLSLAPICKHSNYPPRLISILPGMRSAGVQWRYACKTMTEAPRPHARDTLLKWPRVQRWQHRVTRVLITQMSDTFLHNQESGQWYKSSYSVFS